MHSGENTSQNAKKLLWEALLDSFHCQKVLSFRLPSRPFHPRAAFLGVSGLQSLTEKSIPSSRGWPFKHVQTAVTRPSHLSWLAQPHLTSVGLDSYSLLLSGHPPLTALLSVKTAHTRAHTWVCADLNPGPLRAGGGAWGRRRPQSPGAVLPGALPRKPRLPAVAAGSRSGARPPRGPPLPGACSSSSGPRRCPSRTPGDASPRRPRAPWRALQGPRLPTPSGRHRQLRSTGPTRPPPTSPCPRGSRDRQLARAPGNGSSLRIVATSPPGRNWEEENYHSQNAAGREARPVKTQGF